MMNRKTITAARYVLGLLLVVFGLNGFFRFLPMPTPPEAAGRFLGAMMETGYLLPLVKLVELTVGVLLLANRFVPLALVLLAPVSVNIIAFHLFLDPAGIVPGAVIAALQALLLLAYRPVYEPMLQAKVDVEARTRRKQTA
ncbi:hypothetical protein GQ464_006910 [Rhodocaloribacter litoris]|uniref:DoxX family membrane protein n=1 Tax=Rhodocaloribacter litoris TaxID=2558931 RepID=UPI00141F1887|nr:DoxX family membrane protein [Rhodocaloribacter litoris]QXD16662.1 hypothetical protein GQ464_006910 [Rhodocaloribacter litoris]